MPRNVKTVCNGNSGRKVLEIIEFEPAAPVGGVWY